MNASDGRRSITAQHTSIVPTIAYQEAVARASSGVSAHGQCEARSPGNRYSAAAPASIATPATADSARTRFSRGSASGCGSAFARWRQTRYGIANGTAAETITQPHLGGEANFNLSGVPRGPPPRLGARTHNAGGSI